MKKHNSIGGDCQLQLGTAKPQGPVECLGISFPDDNARREHFLGILREKLKEPEFRKIEGFPIGSDDDILALSDPPYYTVCPNPFIGDFIKLYGKPYDPTKPYGREPFAADVSEGKNDPIYNAHTYHTKVPHKAIMRYILNYTEPGDIVLDFFCGTGMTGLAAQECAHLATSYSDIATEMPTAVSGHRRCVLCDLSPIATFIAQNYVRDSHLEEFENSAAMLIKKTEDELGWMFRTSHTGWPMLDRSTAWVNTSNSQSDIQGRVNFFVWSERFICPHCSCEFPISVAIDFSDGKAPRNIQCPNCSSSVTKRELNRVMETIYDPLLGRQIKRVKRELVLINYTWKGKRYEKWPDDDDISLLDRVHAVALPPEIPVSELPYGERRLKDAYDNIGITHVHHFYFARTLHVLGRIAIRIEETSHIRDLLTILFTSQLVNLSVMNRFRRVSFPYNPMSGTFYVGSLVSEANPFDAYRNKIKRFVRAKAGRAALSSIIGTQSSTDLLLLPANSIDYIFVDPPFGRNLHYSELNSVWEAWLGVKTDRNPEAVMDRGRNRELFEYASLMRRCFEEGYRVLKPGRWMTVEFHNSSNAVWNAIQESLVMAGFVVADVRTLDKQAETYKQSQQNLVKADLIISAYKPNGGLEDRFKFTAGTEGGAWDFVRTHLRHLPVFVSKDGQAEPIAERMSYLLFDRMVAFHVQRSVTVPLSAAEFYEGLVQRFSERDDMYFLPEQVAEYDKKRMTAREVLQLKLFVTDEASAILWLKQQLIKKPQTFQELHPQFLKEIGGWQKHEMMLELSELLGKSFLRYDGRGEVPSRIHSYLSTNFKELRNLPKDDERLRAKGKDRWYVPDPNQARDLEKLRERSLLKEFDEYRTSTQKRLKVFRLEAMRAGFKNAWQERDYATIISVARKIPEDILQEDPKLLMWYDQALTRSGDA